jgi:hypothetical protein
LSSRRTRWTWPYGFCVQATRSGTSTRPPNNIEIDGSYDLLGAKEVVNVGLTKKEQQIVQCKVRRLIVNKACKLAIIKKTNGHKQFFVTYDPSRKPQPPHRNIWINMLHGYCSCLDPSIDNINAQPHHLMNEVLHTC